MSEEPKQLMFLRVGDTILELLSYEDGDLVVFEHSHPQATLSSLDDAIRVFDAHKDRLVARLRKKLEG